MLIRTFSLFLFFAAPAMGWWCEGHEAVAIIAGRHMSPAATAAATKLLKDYPALIPRVCKDAVTDVLAIASTWADDVKKGEKTGSWHYMDIPLGLKKGDPEEYCTAIGPSVNGSERPGCILSALRSMVNILHSAKESDEEKAVALRYLIHLAWETFTSRCILLRITTKAATALLSNSSTKPKISNLHSVWDGMALNRDLAAKSEKFIDFADRIDQQYASKRAGWVKNAPEFDKWAMEGHLIAQKVVPMAALEPKPPVEKYDLKPECKVERDRFGALHIVAGDTYEKAAAPVIEEQLAKAGYRLAEILNIIWP